MESRRRPYWQIVVSLIFSLAATAAFVIIGIKALGFLMPFVIGWIISSIASPVVNWLEKRLKIVKKLGSALIVVVVLVLIVMLIYFAFSRITAEVGDLVENFPGLYAQLEVGLRQIGNTMSGVFLRLPEGVQHGWNAVVQNLDQSMGNLVTRISRPTMTAAGNFAKSLPSYLISFIVVMMSAYFFTVERDEVIQWLKKVSPPSVAKRMDLVMDNLRYAVGGYFKAQFKIMAIVFVILFAGFAVLGVHYSVLIAFLIAFLDFLPFFGTGTAMIPWALYTGLMGDYKMTVSLIIIYIVTQLVRQLLQPKLVGDSMGMNPLVTLLLLYIGYKVSSVIGMILAVPIGLVLINMIRAGAFDYILDDVRLLVEGILGLREESDKK
ncbi:sporulation integral membrane protein YtvI [Faecalicatena contorta]|uniref:Sporulation integral membrane protein YtvI n=1 Tax=Faecalicatena contorta TaxID=39482 RepID=A0A315ZST4_9FIRM|nr:sporulation integral membrane protein YtvI [Faecalicatena contorta]PWJ48342.1 sporulation integral membrane protein YtvI [Faecalicatena contorta]SUQ15365.1 sporulation integral membrane protein YtvI [Faecalicatena contorta]